MTRNPLAPEGFGWLRRATRCFAAACLGGAMWLTSAPANCAMPAAGHGLPGDSVLPRGVPPAARRAWMARQSALCLEAIADAGDRYRLPRGLLGAVSRVETGRPLPVTGDRQPWPWSVNADGETLFFDTRAQAVVETTRRLSGGARYVDIGCMQVDLRMHRDAFANLAEAFNPVTNAEYAARLLVSLRSGHGVDQGWARASGLYHSGTPGVMEPYRDRVARMRSMQRETLD